MEMPEVSMPNQSPVSRYLLVGMAALMFGAALPDVEWMLARARQLRSEHRGQRIVVVDGVRIR
jgi:hypothetical protein